MRCPYCAEEIQDAAVKCKHCGEWLNQPRSAPAPSSPTSQQRPNYGPFQLYRYVIRSLGGSATQGRFVFALDLDSARAQASKDIPLNFTIDDVRGFMVEPKGRFSCPNCASQFTICQRDIGCAVLLIIFVSLGLGLLLIPLLPFNGDCRAFGYKWKS